MLLDVSCLRHFIAFYDAYVARAPFHAAACIPCAVVISMPRVYAARCLSVIYFSYTEYAIDATMTCCHFFASFSRFLSFSPLRRFHAFRLFLLRFRCRSPSLVTDISFAFAFEMPRRIYFSLRRPAAFAGHWPRSAAYFRAFSSALLLFDAISFLRFAFLLL